jgi:hypothetical protein
MATGASHIRICQPATRCKVLGPKDRRELVILRVEGIAQAVADEVEAEQGDREERGWEDQEPGADSI